MQPRSQVLSPFRLVSFSLSRCVGRVGENPGNEVVLDGVANMDVGFEASDSGSKHPSSIYLFYFILHSKVGVKLLLTERNNMALADVT